MLSNDPLWYKDAVIYELHVRAFHDSVGDGMGDFRGLTQKLDYLQDLGVTAVWLLPFYPSPLKDDGYDIADYTDIHTDYGTLRDCKEFLDAAHARGIRVITELVINHTSDQHPWFQRARRAKPGSSLRDFYVWSDTPNKYKGARIIFQDFEQSNWTWDPVGKAYFWHRFYAHQPELNYDNPEVWKAIFPVVDFWMGLGVDGMRLDAVPYLYEREGTNCENLPETHQFLKALRAHTDSKFANRVFLAEANQWPEDAAAYFGNGDECQMNYHFPLMPRMFMAIHMEDRFPITDILAQTPTIADNCQWALFLRNHDELTLEMVTDEERDYMYRAYAVDQRARLNLGIRRRLAPLLGNNRRRMELMNGLLFSFPGTPIIYYGDEIGMGDNIYLGDRNGVRTPMQWSSDRNAGFSRCNPQKLFLPVIIDPEYHYEAISVESQQQNPSSFLWWMKRLISLRKRLRAFGRGSIQFLHPDNRKILTFLRRYQEECVLVVANLSRFVQYVELDLSEFKGHVPVELFGRNLFPPIGSQPYLLTLGPHSFYWFSLQPRGSGLGGGAAESVTPQDELPVLTFAEKWTELFTASQASAWNDAISPYLIRRRWFGRQDRNLKGVTLADAIPVPYPGGQAYLTLLSAEFEDVQAETYVLPLAFAQAEQAKQLQEKFPHTIVARCTGPGVEGVLFDAVADPGFCAALLDAIGLGRIFENNRGASIRCLPFSNFETHRGPEADPLPASMGKSDQSNTSILFGNRLIMKLLRRVEEGIHPELEIGNHLTEVAKFSQSAAVVGGIEYRRRRKATPMTLAILQGFIPNQGDAWQYTLDALSTFFERVVATPTGVETREPPPEGPGLLDLTNAEPSALAREMIESFLETARLLGERTAQMHLALAGADEDAAFALEPYSTLYQRAVYQTLRNSKGQAFHHLQHKIGDLGQTDAKNARRLLEMDEIVMRRIHSITDIRVTAQRLRCHGDFDLGQILYTGNDFVIIDFEGEPARSINERRIKRCALRDLAGLVRSLHYAAFSSLYGHGSPRGHLPGVVRKKDIRTLVPWATYWYRWVSATCVKAYLATAKDAAFLPRSSEEFRVLLDVFLLEKAITELTYELTHRPDWVHIPLVGILQLLEVAEPEA